MKSLLLIVAILITGQSFAIEQVAVINPKEGKLELRSRLKREMFLDYGANSQTRSLENSQNLQKDNQGVAFGYGRNDILSSQFVLTTSGEIQFNFIDMKNESVSLVTRDYSQFDYGITEKLTYLTSARYLPNFILKIGQHWGKETILDQDMTSDNYQEFQREYKRISAALGIGFKLGETNLYALFERSQFYLDEVLYLETLIDNKKTNRSGLIRDNNNFYTERLRFGIRFDF
jgi:hypothetical protein